MAALKQVAEAAADSKHSAELEQIVLHGDSVYTCADDGIVKIWSKDLKLERELQAHEYAIYSVLVLKDKLITGGIDSTIKVWNLATLELEQTLTEHGEAVRKLTTDGEKLWSGDDAGHVNRWTVSPSVVRESAYEVSEEVWDLKVHDKYFVNVRDRGVSITETHVGGSNKYTVVKSLQGRAPLYLSSKYLVYGQFSGGFGLHLHHNQPVEFPNITNLVGHDAIVTCMTGSIMGANERLATGGYDNKIKLWELPAGTLVSQHDITVTPSTVAADTDGAIYVGGPDGYLVKLMM